MIHNYNTVSPQTMRFRVLVGEDVKKITFENGLPFCVNDFTEVVKQAFSLGDNISLHYKDSDFDDFFTLSSTKDLRDKDTIKVVQLLNEIPELPELPSIRETLQLNSNEQMDLNLDLHDSSSVASEDSAPLSIQDSTESQDRLNKYSPGTFRKLWPAVFEIPTFSYSTEVVLREANDKFLKDGSLVGNEQLKHIKSDILERLAETMFMYTAYPRDYQRMIVCQELIKKHPYLKEAGTTSGIEGWSNSLRFKVNNYRTKLRNRGNQELLVNSVKHKPEGQKSPAQVKKARKSEVNFLPPFPLGETDPAWSS
ncbi:hypothetical protein WMY93_000461 [Mugilogobius chulae]|uniref:PB1 domain-containing protein n=1 Tax=Mugilogobius chulae TaxID=88201 RepID=A0AAW0Q7L6_9GOBI